MNILGMCAVCLAMGIACEAVLNARCVVENRNGTCIPIRDCPPLFALFQQQASLSASTIETLRKFHCGFQSTHPLMCCTTSTVTSQPLDVDEPAPRDVSTHRNVGLINQLCGQVAPVNRIINGENSAIYEFPWMARLKIRSWRGDRFTCGGTLINSRYVLTAAHCIPRNNETTLVSVSLGYHELTEPELCEESGDCIPPPQNINVSEILLHPRYSYGGSYAHDIALVRLATAANLDTDTVIPICLPMELSMQTQDLDGLWLTVAGWGQTTTSVESPDLLKVSVPVVSTAKCQDQWQRFGSNVSSSQLCAGDSSLIRGSCRGDSGGPFMTASRINSELKMVQYGIISYGPGSCTNVAVPVVYTRVGHYMNWILDTLRP